MKLKLTLTAMMFFAASITMQAQSELYPKHFNLEEVTLLDGPMKTAMELNFKTLLAYDVDRLLTPYVRQSGLAATNDSNSDYYQWEQKHPNFSNWGGNGFDLSGHVGGHYLTALALAYAACHDADMKAQLKERMEYMLKVMKDCQDQFDQNTEGLYGFIGGQPINDSWKELYKGSTTAIRNNWGWVPFYCQHKILAGLRDAYLYGNNEQAKTMFLKLADWSANVISKTTDSDFEGFLNCEHGGMNESLLDAYQLTGQAKYLTAAKKYTHKAMLNGMQTIDKTFLDGKHANTQVPKFIGMERIFEQDATAAAYKKAAENFWTDVAQNRTVCIGGNSVGEHFLSIANSNRYIDHLDGPESCNTNNMMKFSEMLADRTGDAKYADFYEYAMLNHILSTQDPTTGGYVYFTTLRPQAYRIYSMVNQGMWCCVGTGMENHSKYGHFIYTHEGKDKLYVNLFTPSKLENENFVITQQTSFPYEPKTTLTVGKAGTYAIALRHPAWAADGYQVSVNGQAVNTAVKKGEASYVTISRTWTDGDKIEVSLPMELKYTPCPNYTDYIAFSYGPVLLAAKTTATTEAEAEETGLAYEKLQNEYGGEGRMDHAPGSRAKSMNLTTAPLLIGERSDVLKRIKAVDTEKLTFTLDASRQNAETYKWNTLTLVPFYSIHHQRYSCYFYQQTEENFKNSSMAKDEAEADALKARTLDFVAPGEQQSEAGHKYNYSSDSQTGEWNTERYRDARANGYIEYVLTNNTDIVDSLSIMLRFNVADKGRMATLTINGTKAADITIPASAKGQNDNGFYNIEFPISKDMAESTKEFKVRLTASSSTLCPGLYYVRLMRGYDNHAYVFRANEWTTGDSNRIPASSITYDEANNVIKAVRTGSNNIALMLKYQETDYTIDKSQTFLIVRGTGLKTGNGDSYLWWLNGANKGSQISPNVQQTASFDGSNQLIFAWDMTKSGLYTNFAGNRPSVCMGQTIFGLTSANADGSCEIYDINFASSVETYLNTTKVVNHMQTSTQNDAHQLYNIGGIRAEKTAIKGIFIEGDRKVVK